MKFLDYFHLTLFNAVFFVLAIQLFAQDEKLSEPENIWCPILTDEKIEPEYTVSHEGKSVGLCCDKCKRKFLKNPQKYLENLPQFNKDEVEEIKETEQEVIDSKIEAEKKESTQEAEQEVVDPKIEAEKKESTQEAENTLPLQEKGNHEDKSENKDPKESKPSEGKTFIQQIFRYVGKFHPVIVHFPIALTITAAMSEAVFMLSKKFLFSNLARFNLAIAGLSSILAALTGWINASFIKVSAELEWPLFLHRWLGISSTILILCAVICSELAPRLDNSGLKVGYRASLFTATILVAATGHFGGIMVFGADYFKW